MADDLVVGIDLGTTNSCIAVARKGRIDVIPNIEGKRTTPSFVYYGPTNDVLVGKTAQHEAAANPTNGIYEIKRILGCLHDDPEIELIKPTLTYNLRCATNGEIQIELDQFGTKQPEEICARILHKLKRDAESYLNQTVSKAVITVPAYFNNNQRAATRVAAKIAGFDLLKLVNEPSAAALAYINDNKSDKARTILIYDLGGGTFDVSIVRAEGGNIRVHSVAGDSHLGGQDILNRLVTYTVNEIEAKHRIQIKNHKRLMHKIRNLCEKSKKNLTTAHSTSIVVELPHSEQYSQLVITRSKFEEINDDLFRKTVEIVNTCMKNGNVTKKDIDEVLLVGGSARIPKVEALLKDFFGDKTIQRNINADEAVAMGAAIEAANFLQNHSVNHRSFIVDVLPLSIGAVLDEEEMISHFARNTPIPASSKHIHTVRKKSNTSPLSVVSFYEGCQPDYRNNVLLGACEIRWLNLQVTKRSVEISIRINCDGICWIAIKGDTVKTFSIVLNKGRLDDDEILRIKNAIQKSVHYAQ